MQTQITRRCVIEEEIEELSEKPLRRPPSGNQSTRQSVGIHGLARDPPSLIYLMHLSSSSSYSNKASWNRVLSNFQDPTICLIASTKPHRLLLAIPQNFPNSKTLSTLWKCVNCVLVQISSQGMAMGEGMRRGYNDFSLKMSRSLSKRWVCCVIENLSRVFLSEYSLILLWVIRVYIVWMKGKKVTLKTSRQNVLQVPCGLALLARQSRNW